jgi:hypothetical protein
MQQDAYLGTAADPLSLNLYTYCHNEPIMYADPSGYDPELRKELVAAGCTVNDDPKTKIITVTHKKSNAKVELYLDYDYQMKDGKAYFSWVTYGWVIDRINENLKEDTTSKDTTTKNPAPPGGGNNGNTGSPGGGVYNPPVIKQEKPTNLLNMDIGIFINTFYQDKNSNRPFRAWIDDEYPNTLQIEYFFAFAGDFKHKYNESDEFTFGELFVQALEGVDYWSRSVSMNGVTGAIENHAFLMESINVVFTATVLTDIAASTQTHVVVNFFDDKTITRISPGLYPPSNPSDKSLYNPGHIDIYPYYYQANKEPGLLKQIIAHEALHLFSVPDFRAGSLKEALKVGMRYDIGIKSTAKAMLYEDDLMLSDVKKGGKLSAMDLLGVLYALRYNTGMIDSRETKK